MSEEDYEDSQQKNRQIVEVMEGTLYPKTAYELVEDGAAKGKKPAAKPEAEPKKEAEPEAEAKPAEAESEAVESPKPEAESVETRPRASRARVAVA